MIPENAIRKWKVWSEERALKRHIQRLEDEAHKPRSLMSIPRRSLTPPELELPSHEIGRQFNVQQQSLFFGRLSFDIRRLVYQKILGSACFHIIRRGARLAYLLCYAREASHARARCWGRENFDGTFQCRYTGRGRPIEDYHSWYNGDRRTIFGTDGGILPILLTCKVIYSEVVTFLYSENTFAFWEAASFASFLSIVPSRRLAQIRSLHLQLGHATSNWDQSKRKLRSRNFQTETDWVSIWTSIVQRLRGLKSLEVVILHPPEFWISRRSQKATAATGNPDMIEENDSLVAPLLDFRHVNQVEVVLPEECRPSPGMEANVRFRFCDSQERVNAIFPSQSQNHN